MIGLSFLIHPFIEQIPIECLACTGIGTVQQKGTASQKQELAGIVLCPTAETFPEPWAHSGRFRVVCVVLLGSRGDGRVSSDGTVVQPLKELGHRETTHLWVPKNNTRLSYRLGFGVRLRDGGKSKSQEGALGSIWESNTQV